MQPQVRVEDYPRRIRISFGGQCIVDTMKTKSVWIASSQSYFFPRSEIDERYLGEAPQDESVQLEYLDLVVGDKRAFGAVQRYTKIPELADLLNIKFSAVDAWYEEDEQIHLKTPAKRIEIVPSPQHVRIEIEGVEVANTHRSRLLFETGHQPRRYLPKADCKMDTFEPSALTTRCPFKGTANYYNIRLPSGRVVKDVVWYYENPFFDAAGIAGYVAFYDNKVSVWVDGEQRA